MMYLALLIALLLTVVIGRLLVRFLGWPVTFAALRRWGLALLGLSVIYCAAPELLRALFAGRGPMPAIPVIDLVPTLCILGLAILGYFGSARAAEEREARANADERTRFMPRKRAAPLPPPQGGGALPGQVFNPVATPGDDDAD